MNAFNRCNMFAARSLEHLRPFLLETQGRYVLTDKGRLSKIFQATFGDLIFNSRDGGMYTVELKAESRWTGNLFLEIWSNFNFSERDSYLNHGPKPGWLMTLNADLLFYHFPNQDRLVIMSLPALQQWAFCRPSRNMSEPDSHGERHQLSGRVFDFRQATQASHVQRNTTVGALVPISMLAKELSPAPKTLSVRQLRLDLFGSDAA